MTKTTIFIAIIFLISCTQKWPDKVEINSELTNFNNNPFEDTSRFEYGNKIFNSDFEIIEKSYSSTQDRNFESEDLLGSCFCFLNKDTLQIYLARQGFDAVSVYNKIDKKGNIESYYHQATDTYVAERDRYQIHNKRIELNQFPVKPGDTLIGKLLAEHEFEFEEWQVEWKANGNFKCIVRKR